MKEKMKRLFYVGYICIYIYMYDILHLCTIVIYNM